ncbi:hypothetical protein CHUAL_003518 [Chamberlinius hualienensis]
MPTAAFLNEWSKPRESLEGSEIEMNHLRNLEWLHDELCLENGRILILDCRLQTYYLKGHIRGAINVTLPSLLLRRLANGKVAISSLIKCNDSREIFLKNWKSHTIVLCGDVDDQLNMELGEQSQSSLVLLTLYHRLEQDGCHVVYLQGGYSEFREKYPKWCSGGSSENCSESEGPLIGLQNLRISSTESSYSRQVIGRCGSDTDSASSSSEDFCDSCLDLSSEASCTPPFDDSFPFPVEILPNLFLGNARNAADMDALERHKIKYILNVTSDLPNIFKHDPHIHYLQIPISDHWSQNLASFFPEAIAFIDEARQKQLGVLVHCLAGISRSVTITVAYLMHKFSMPLNDAYEFVKKRKANISPNFSFMGQLLDYEKELNLSPATCLPICEISHLQPQIAAPPHSTSSNEVSTDEMATTDGMTSSTSNHPIRSQVCCCRPDIPCVCLSGVTPDSGIDIGNWV